MNLRYFLYLIFMFPAVLFAKPGINSNSKYAPLTFIENQGQWDGPFVYKAVTERGSVFLEKNGFTFLMEDPFNARKMDAAHHGQITTPPTLFYHAYKLTFQNANIPVVTASKFKEEYCNYFLGNDPSRWKSKIHPCMALDYTGLYKGIDMHVSSERGNMKYEFIVQPNTDVSQIRLGITGANRLSVNEYGNLVISTSVGDVTELKPYAYQYVGDQKIEVLCNYRIKNNVVTYSFPKDYDASQILVIDPTVVFATFTGSKTDNWGFTATYDPQGNFYAGGIAYSAGYPATTGAFQTTFAGGRYGGTSDLTEYSMDVAIMKLNASGTSRIWATYLGGADNESPHSMIVDTANNLIVNGRTYSNDFPVTSGAYQTSFKGGKCDMFVTKFKADGSALIGSTYIGGSADDGMNYDSTEYGYGNLKHNYGDDARSEVQIDKYGNIYVAASTYSTDFPTTATAYKTTLTGGEDAVVFKMNSTLTSLLWSTYLGGSNDDAAYVLAFDTSQQHLYVGGGTMSSDFPATSGTLYPTYKGGPTDGFIVKFLNSGSYTLQKSTFMGTSNYDQVYGLQVDFENSLYAMGQSLGGHFPVTSGVYSNAHSSQFVIKLDSNLSTDIYSTIFGSGDSLHTNISPVAFLVDTCQNVYISGWGGTLGISSMPTSVGTNDGMPITSDAVQPTTDGKDFYFIVLSKNATSLLYGSYRGESGGAGEHVDGGTSRFDKTGIVYQAICGGCWEGSSSSFPTGSSSGATVWSPGDSSINCNEIALKIAFNLSAVKAKADVHPNAKGCAPFTVHFTDSSTDAVAYSWNFNDGSPIDTTFAPTHTFTSPGVFTVRFVAKNPNACKVLDTVFLTVTVDTTNEHPAFSKTVVDSCGPFQVAFNNTSVYSATPGSSLFTKFIWLFGDSTSYSGTTPPTHTYKTNGLYTVSLVMIDSTACNSPDTVKQTVRFTSVQVTPNFTGPDSVCIGKGATYADASINATSYTWDFGDGSPTVSGTPVTHFFAAKGVYTITYVVGNPASCSPFDTMTRNIVVLDTPLANFSYTPSTPETNIPKTFTNLSVKATNYYWDFGDGTSSNEQNPVHIFRKTGTYSVCLTATNGSSSCPSKICKLVQVDIRTLVDVPTGFSPNGDGVNDILYVRGAAIDKISFKIFNRWGQKVFETNDVNIGWDGKYNGKPQEMEVYAYTLDVVFIDGSTSQKKGNITLLR